MVQSVVKYTMTFELRTSVRAPQSTNEGHHIVNGFVVFQPDWEPRYLPPLYSFRKFLLRNDEMHIFAKQKSQPYNAGHDRGVTHLKDLLLFSSYCEDVELLAMPAYFASTVPPFFSLPRSSVLQIELQTVALVTQAAKPCELEERGDVSLVSFDPLTSRSKFQVIICPYVTSSFKISLMSFPNPYSIQVKDINCGIRRMRTASTGLPRKQKISTYMVTAFFLLKRQASPKTTRCFCHKERLAVKIIIINRQKLHDPRHALVIPWNRENWDVCGCYVLLSWQPLQLYQPRLTFFP